MRLRHLLASAALMVTHAVSAAPLLDSLGLPLHQVSATLVNQAIAAAQTNLEPLQFAVSMPMSLNLDDGQWTREGDISRWRAHIQSSGAQTLNFTFSKFRLPPGAALRIYDEQGTVTQGPYTHADESPDGKLWTAVIPGGDAILEIVTDSATRNLVALQLLSVNHGFRGFAKATTIASKAGSCEVDTACSAGDAWRKEIRAVARITINGNTLCSGSLLNNVRQDDTPYFLTANHCGISSSTIATSVVFYWNYQRNTCGSGSGALTQTQSGSSLVSGDSASDYTLLRLNSTPSSSFNVYLNGWNAGGTATAPGAVIHHPNGDEKSISLFNTSGTASTVTLCNGNTITGLCLGTQRSVTAWQISYSQGVTEPGSSGSGLLDANHQIVGQLTGGGSSCSTPTAADYYGRFDRAFVANSNQLKSTLDPGNTGATSLCGKDPGAASCQILSSNSSGGSISGSSGSVSNTSSTSKAATSSSGGGSVDLWLLLSLMGLRGVRFIRKR